MLTLNVSRLIDCTVSSGSRFHSGIVLGKSSGQLSLFRKIETAQKQMEPLVNRQLAFEASLTNYIILLRTIQ